MVIKKNPFPFWFLFLFLFLTGVLIFSRFYQLQIVPRRQNKKTTSKIRTSFDINRQNLSEEELTAALSYLKFRKIKSEFIPAGVPEVYGAELNISFDKVQEAINKVRAFGPTYGQEGQKILLSGPDLERYKKIGESTACEYCCGVKTLTRPDGSAACGCAHSIMMRGLAAYLIKNHPQLSDEWILKEINKWKAVFFPKQTLAKKLTQLEKSGDPSVKGILKEFPDFLPQMVGGC